MAKAKAKAKDVEASREAPAQEIDLDHDLALDLGGIVLVTEVLLRDMVCRRQAMVHHQDIQAMELRRLAIRDMVLLRQATALHRQVMVLRRQAMVLHRQGHIHHTAHQYQAHLKVTALLPLLTVRQRLQVMEERHQVPMEQPGAARRPRRLELRDLHHQQILSS